VHQLTVKYTSQQNKVAKQFNRTLVEMARCLMLQGNLPDSLSLSLGRSDKYSTYVRTYEIDVEQNVLKEGHLYVLQKKNRT